MSENLTQDHLSKTLIQLSVITSLLLSPTLHAQPTAWPPGPWNLNGVKNNTSSTIMADTQDPKTVWVLPPSAGTTSPGQLVGISANVGFCEEMADLQGYSRQISKKIDDLALEAASSESEVRGKEDAYYSALKAASALTVNNQAIQRISELNDQVSDLESQLQTLYSSLGNCDTNTTLCDSISQQIKSKDNERSEDRAELRKLRNQYSTEYTQYLRAKSVAASAKSEYDEALSYLDEIQNRMTSAKNSLQNLYKNLGLLYGAQTEIIYDTGWDKNVAKLRKENDPRLQFMKPFTNHTRLHVGFSSAPDRQTYLNELPILLSYTLNGVSHAPYENPSATEGAALPNKMQAILNLNLLGTCPLLHPELFKLDKDPSALPKLGVSATYEYPAAFKTRIKFQYNLSKFYEVMHDSGSSGGFFSTHSWDSISETKLSHEAFSADWEESDPDHVVPEDQKRQIEKEVKKELMERVLADFGEPMFDGRSVNASTPPPSGAMVLAEGLQSTCGSDSFYCSGGTWLLKGLSAIFGNSDRQSHLKQDFKADVTEEWSRETVRYKPGVMVFIGK